MKWKAFFITFKRLSLKQRKQVFLKDESSSLRVIYRHIGDVLFAEYRRVFNFPVLKKGIDNIFYRSFEFN